MPECVSHPAMLHFPSQFKLTLVLGMGLAVLSVPAFSKPVIAGEKTVVENILIRIIDEVEVPAREAGALVTILVREGEPVKAGQVIARIDNTVQDLQFRRAALELSVARREFENQAPLQLAHKSVELEQQSAIEQEFTQRIAHKKAENLYKIEAATKQMGVAKNEYERALAARKQFRDSISDSELDGRQLSFEHADLQSKQTRFEQEIEGLLAEAEDLAARTRVLSIEQAQLQVSDVSAKRDVSAMQVKLKENEVESAREALERREIRSPIDGTIVHINRRAGEWIEPGQTCMRIVRLNRLRSEGFLSARYATKVSQGDKASVLIELHNSEQIECQGTITFVSPEIDPVNNEMRIWVEIDNPKDLIRPGMHGTLTIDVPAAKQVSQKTP
ncbi:MAG TPA: efflux RND transporter periplasmic adaptor subunit [Planctomicrobium sp.]|nr:efflux RND transporter periplasmic adaptor subunit [Planctomicrobium sp.]